MLARAAAGPHRRDPHQHPDTTTPDTTTTWPRARAELQRQHTGTFTGPAGLFRQTTPPNAEVRRIHTALDIALPPPILELDPDPEQAETR